MLILTRRNMIAGSAGIAAMTAIPRDAWAVATTLNSADKSAGIALSNGDLTMTYSSGSGTQGARATISKSAGKVYFEAAINQAVGGQLCLGMSNASAAFTTLGSLATGGLSWYTSGAVWKGGSSFFTARSYGNSTTNGVAIDFPNALIWLRNSGASTNWNGSTSNDPAAGTGGQSLSGLNAALFPFAAIQSAAGGPWTFNFGATAFAMTVPTGFTAWDAAAGRSRIVQ